MSHTVEEKQDDAFDSLSRRKRKSLIKKFLKKRGLSDTPDNRLKARKAIRKRLNQRAKNPEGKEISIQQSAGDWQIIYGKQRVGGVLTYVSTATNNTELLLVFTVAAHQINAIRKVFFDDIEVTFPTNPPSGWSSGAWLNKVFIEVNLGSEHQSALSQLQTDSGGQWTSNHRQRGCAHCYIKLVYDEHLFPNGMPNVTFEVEGKVLDAAGGGYGAGYSTNAAHCLFDYLDDRRWGANAYVQSQNIIFNLEDDIFSTFEALDICNQDVSLVNGGTEKRYTVNATFTAAESPLQVIDQMLSAFGGTLVDFGSSNWHIAIVAPKYRTPTYTIIEDDILSEISIATVDALSEYFGKTAGTYVEPSKNYEETDFPPYTFSPGASNYTDRQDIALPTTTSYTTAQRLAKLETLHRKYSLVARMRVRLNWFKLSAGDNVMVTTSRLGWSAKVFEVQALQLIIDSDQNGNPMMAIELELKENAEDIYNWSTSEEQNISNLPTLNFPLPGTSAATNPTNLTVTSGNNVGIVQSDGSINVRALLEWSAPSDGFVSSGGAIEIEFSNVDDAGAWQDGGEVDGSTTRAYLYSLRANTNYQFRIRGRQVGGLTGDWVFANHYVLPPTPTPPNVGNFIGVVTGPNISFTWDPIYQGNLAFYRIKESLAGASWGASTLIGEVVGQPFTYTYNAAATYKIKAVNSQGVESTTETNHQLATTPLTGNPVGLLLSLTTT